MLYLALPVMNEYGNLPALIYALNNQRHKEFKLFVCVNQYEAFWEDERHRTICEDNRKSLDYLHAVRDFEMHIIDRSSRGKGWPRKRGGVGYARKTVMDKIAETARPDDVIVSIDADTFYPENYLYEINRFFGVNQKIHGLSLPYYHPLPDDENLARQILRYELYMRYYALNMVRIKNPYRFTALGSAMAFPVWAYKKTGGLTPVAAGEDFYFLQKLVKTGPIAYTAQTVAYPSARLSDRVQFGTGPALIKGIKGDWSSYPFYHSSFFDEVAETYGKFKELYYGDRELPMEPFLKKQLGSNDLWGPLRKNFKDERKFRQACIQKADGLRILQYLRFRQSGAKTKDELVLALYLKEYHRDVLTASIKKVLDGLDFEKTPVEQLNALRNVMFRLEKRERENEKDIC